MSKKSNFLRTVGVNPVLTLAGAPSCAKHGQVSNLKLYPNLLIGLYEQKNKTKNKNSALCLSEKLVSFCTLRFIHKSVASKLTKNEKKCRKRRKSIM
jgi:hypothetical protein